MFIKRDDFLTFKGHEFINTIREDKIWNKTKEKLKTLGNAITIQAITDVATKAFKELI